MCSASFLLAKLGRMAGTHRNHWNVPMIGQNRVLSGPHSSHAFTTGVKDAPDPTPGGMYARSVVPRRNKLKRTVRSP